MTDYYYSDLSGNQCGPVQKAALKGLWSSNQINNNTQIWYDGLANWCPMSDLPDLIAFCKPAEDAPPKRPVFSLPATLPTLKKVDAGGAQAPAAAAAPKPSGGGGGGGLMAEIAARKKQMDSQPKAAPAPAPAPSPKPSGGGGSLFDQIQAQKARMAQQQASPQPPASPEPDEYAPKQTFAVPAAPAVKQENNSANWQVLKSPEGIEYYVNTVTKETTWTKPRELLSADELGRSNFKWVWKPDDYQAFIPAKVLPPENGYQIVQTDDGQTHRYKPTEVLDPLTWEHLRNGATTSDLVLLDEMSLPLILHTLKARFQTNQIYTNVGTILIALNPYKRITELYTPESISQYQSRGSKHVAPHVYLVASEALNQLLETKAPQSICISGESGAGKTECTKQALQYLAECAGNPASNVEHKILASNPILEAFGNAKTVRNNNSSRFGKYVEINFDHNMTICGSTNTNYLLEKVRVVKPNKGERNYHSFYQMLRGFDDAQKRKYHLTRVEDYHILTLSGSTEVPGMDDKREHDDVINAMQELGWKQEEMDKVYQTLAAILHIGNIQFRETGDRKCSVIDQAPIDYCCELLELDKTVFTKAVTTRIMIVPMQPPIDVPLSKDEAQQARDALAKFIYEKMFDWIVQRVNSAIGRGNPATYDGRTCTIGILDIFGFEIFEHNQFEQLCINFTNEKLQQFFNQHTFKKEEEVYKSEGIRYDQVTYIDNQPMLDLIELKPRGVLPCVDEEIKMPKGSDKSFLSKLVQNQKNNTYFKQHLKQPDMFVIEHYAGKVVYDSNGFLEKNRDKLNDDAYKAITSSRFQFLVDLFNDTNPASRATLGTKFAKQLNDLMAALNLTEPHYIRCIKPNPNKAQMEFHPVMVLEQLRYSGVFEAVKIRKMGFPFRYTHIQFWKRFKCIFPPEEPWSPGDMVANCKKLIEKMNQSTSVVQIGRTRVLYRSTAHREMELVRNLAVDKVTTQIQQRVRAWLARRVQKKCLDAQPKLQKAIDTRTIAALESTIAQVGSLGFDLWEMTRAKRLIFVINEENRLEKLIATLLEHRNVESQFEILERCVAEADDVEFKSAVAERARVVLQEIKDKRQAREWLQTGPAEADQAKCEWAVAVVARLKMPEPTADAVAMIERCKKETQLVDEIERCLAVNGYVNPGDSFDPTPLRRAVDTAAAFVCKTKRGIPIFEKAVVLAGVRDTLKAAIGTKDRLAWKACGAACAKAVSPLDEHPEVVRAAQEVNYQSSVDDVTDNLGLGLNTLDQEILTYNLRQAEMFKVDEQKYAVVPQARVILNKIIEAKSLMTDAVNSVDEVKLMYAVQYAESFGYEKPQTVACRELRDHVMICCSDAQYALEVMEREPMKEIAARAHSLNLKTPQIAEIEKWLSSSEEKFVQQQLKVATKLKDEPRVIRLTIQLKDMMINRAPQQFAFQKYGRFRNTIEWANLKAITLNRDKLQQSFFNFTTDAIHASLTELNPTDPNMKTLDNAKKLFKNLLVIMDDRKKGDYVPIIENSLQMCLEDPLLQDEMVCQLIKQLTNIPSTVLNKAEMEKRGWQLLLVWLEQFAPKEVENFLVQWLRSSGKACTETYLSSLHLSSFFGGTKTQLTTAQIKQIISTGKGLRNTDYSTVRPYAPPQPSTFIPPPGQAVQYYQRWVAENMERARAKEKEIEDQKLLMVSLGGQTALKTFVEEAHKTGKDESAPPPPPPVEINLVDYTKLELPGTWAIAYGPDASMYYWCVNEETGESYTCWSKEEIFTTYAHTFAKRG